MAVLATRMRAFSTRVGWPTPGGLARMKPSSSQDSASVPPAFLRMWMADRSVEPFSRSTASTARAAKWSRSPDRIFEESVVRATRTRSALSDAGSPLRSTAPLSRASAATPAAAR